MNKRKTGDIWEGEAVQYLTNLGYTILERNYRCKTGEIDIIAKDGSELVFVEVKYRTNNQYGMSIEAVTPIKQRTIRKVALYYMTVMCKTESLSCRFDVVGFDKIDGTVNITHIRNAF